MIWFGLVCFLVCMFVAYRVGTWIGGRDAYREVLKLKQELFGK